MICYEAARAWATRRADEKLVRRLLQRRVLDLCLFENWNVGIGSFPGRKEILISSSRMGTVASHAIGTRELSVGKRPFWCMRQNSAIFRDRLELRDRVASLTAREVGKSPDVRRKKLIDAAKRVRARRLKFLDGLLRIC